MKIFMTLFELDMPSKYSNLPETHLLVWSAQDLSKKMDIQEPVETVAAFSGGACHVFFKKKNHSNLYELYYAHNQWKLTDLTKVSFAEQKFPHK